MFNKTNIRNRLALIKEFILDILFPIKCFGCGQESEWLCHNCLVTIPLTQKLVCPICERYSNFGKVCPTCRDKTALDGLWAASLYQEKLLQDSIQAFKYSFVEELSQPLGSLLVDMLGKLKAKGRISEREFSFLLKESLSRNVFQSLIRAPDILKKEALLIPVPLHRKRFLERGFNQANLLAQEVAKGFDLQLVTDVLVRKRYTMPQATLKGQERHQNIKNSFLLKDQKTVSNHKIILVDDVFTTGGTLGECAKVLKNGGAEEVWGLVLAKG